MKTLICLCLLHLAVSSTASPPNIEVTYNMRNLKLPRDTKPGTSIYRLRGFDADGDALTFNIRGTDARELLEVRTVSPTQADVILKIQPVRTQYEYTIFVSDGKETSLFPSTIVFTEAKSVSSPFLEYEPIISLLENTPPNQVISYVVAKEKENSNLPVSFELQGSDKFTIKYVFGPRGSSKAELKIVGELDFEEVNYVKLNILALNAWTNVTLDTRNIATVDIVILVQDIQDSPPVFQNPPSLVTISDTLKSGAALVDIRAEDGDTANKNNITYSIDSESSLGSFFSINSTNGTITLLKSVEELRSQYDCCIPLLLEVKATEVSSSQPAETTVKVPFLLEKTDTASSYYSFGSSDSSNTINQPINKISNQSTINRAPRFTSQSYVGTIPENSLSQTAVRWEGAAVTRVIDDDKGDNAMFELFLKDEGGTFQIVPSSGSSILDFQLLVRIPANLDYENRKTKYIDMKVVARETRSSETLSAEAKIRVNILDSNDNIPQFSKETYEATIKEDAAPGTFVTRIYATDRDTGNYGKIRYTAINGPIAELMNLDPDTGEVTLTSSQGLDRENVPKYTLTIEARDDLGRGNRNVTRLEIRLLDINDNKPVFEQPRYDAILNSDLSGFDQKIFIKAKDPDAAGTNNKLTYRILNGPHSDRFRINQATGELTLTRPITSGSQSSATPVVLRVQADDGGSPPQQTTIEVQIHTQDYLNRTIQFIISRPINDVRANKDNVERSLSKLTGSRVNIYYLEPLEGQNEKTVAKAWVAFPQNSTVNTEEVQSAVSNINDREYSQKEETKERMIKKKDYDIIFWLLIALVILILFILLILLICCCCCRCCGCFGCCRCCSECTRECECCLTEDEKSHSRIHPSEKAVIIQETGSMDGSNEKKREDEVLQKKGWKEYNADNQKVERENTNNKEYSHRITSGSHHRIIHYSDGSEDKRYSGNEENMRGTRTKEIIYIRDNRKDSGVPVYPRRTEEERSYQEVDKSSHTRPVVKHSSSYHSGAFHQNGNVRSRHDSYSSSGQDNGSQQLNFSRYHKTGNPHPNTRSISSRQSLYSGNVVLSDNQTRNRQQDQQEKIKPVDYEEYWEKRYGKNKEGESFHFQNMDPDHSVVHIRNLEHLNDSRTEQRGHLYNRNQNAPIPIEMDERNDRRRLQTNTPGNQNNETIIQERIIIRELKENDDPEKFNILQHEISARDPSESQISARDPFESQISARDPSEPDGDQINTEARRGSLDDKNGGTTGRNATGQFQSSYQRPSEERFLDDQSHQQDGQTHTVYKTHVITKTYVTDRKSPENNSFSPKYQTGETHSNTKTSPEISSSHHTSFSVRHTEGLTEETKYSISPEDRTTRENISSDNPEKDANPTRSDDPESGVNSASSVKSNVQIIDKPLKVKKVPRYMEWYNKEKEDKPENNNSS